ncbi:hypothetical protein [Streptomyces sp. NPDC101150]|uniref:hypothetical protein n=1 Tax=Streptomyces sp. NPDC101150 TaxID=3366114 RepID=UPI0037F18AB8
MHSSPVTLYHSAAILVPDALDVAENVQISRRRDRRPRPRATTARTLPSRASTPGIRDSPPTSPRSHGCPTPGIPTSGPPCPARPPSPSPSPPYGPFPWRRPYPTTCRMAPRSQGMWGRAPPR